MTKRLCVVVLALWASTVTGCGSSHTATVTRTLTAPTVTGRGGHTSTATAQPKAGPAGRLAAAIPVRGATRQITTGAGALWVSSDGSETVTRIDPSTNSVVGAPIQTHQFATNVLGGGTGGVFVDSKMFWLDPKTNTLGPPRLTGCGQASLAGDSAGNVWYLDTSTPTSPSDSGCDELAKFNSSTGAEVKAWPFTSTGAFSSIAAGDGQVWLLASNQLSRLDPATGKVNVVRAVGVNTEAFGVSDGVTWWTGPTSADTPQSVMQISDRTSATLPTISLTGPDPLEQGIGGVTSITSGGGRLWAIFTDAHQSALVAYDQRNGQLAGEPVPLPGKAGTNPSVTFAFGALWVSGNNQILRVDPAPCCTDISPSAAPNPNPAPSTSTSASSQPSQCDSFCLQAGPEGGTKSYLCPHASCATCPENGCVRILTRSAHVSAGSVPVQITCLVSEPCAGAFLILQPNHQVGAEGSELPHDEWVAGSNFSVPGNSTATAAIALTPLGKRLIDATNGYRAAIDVLLRNFGNPPLTYAERSMVLYR